jgi:hypothetical protein
MTVNRLPPVPSDKEAVDTILGLARLSMNDEEYERLVRIYPLLREQAAALRIPEVRYGEPAIIYPVLEHR